MPGK
jgi:hypothetical protein